MLKRLVRSARRQPNLTLAIVLAIVAVFTATATGFWLLYRLAYVIAFAIPIAYLWTRSMVRGLEVDVHRRSVRVTQGQPVTGRIVLRSTSRLPKVWLEIEDASTLPGHETRRLLTLPGRGMQAWSYETPTTRRGLHTLGPVTVTATDPFGLFRMTRQFDHPVSVLVYPNAPELPSFAVPPANLPGDGRFRRRTHTVTPNVAGVRGYEPGDSYNRIHWPQTARTGELMVKVFELDPASDIWLLLDLDARVHVGAGDSGTEEASVMVAASIARTFLMAHRSVGLACVDTDLRVDAPDRGANQYTRILESLAVAQAAGDVPLADLITEESRQFGRHTTVVAITPSADASWVLGLIALVARGVQVAAVLIEAETYGAARSSLEVYGLLTAGGVATYTVKRTDDLVQALGAGGGVAARPGARHTSGATGGADEAFA